MNENEPNADRISGEQGSVKPEETLTDVVRQVAFARSDGEKGTMRSAANGAFLNWLAQFAHSEVDDDQEILSFALRQQGFDSWEDFVESFHAADEATMSARKTLEELDVKETLGIEEEQNFNLMDPDEGDSDG